MSQEKRRSDPPGLGGQARENKRRHHDKTPSAWDAHIWNQDAPNQSHPRTPMPTSPIPMTLNTEEEKPWLPIAVGFLVGSIFGGC